jgi:hypothetical protein
LAQGQVAGILSAVGLTHLQPISVHPAILAGAIPEQVAEAAGINVRAVYGMWERWADGQRRIMIAGT